MIIKKENIAVLIKTIYTFMQNSNASIRNETFTNITIELNTSKSILNELKILYKKFEIIQNDVAIIKNKTGEIKTLSDINEEIKDNYFNLKWIISFNKLKWFNYDKYNITAFFDINNFDSYLQSLKIFNQDNEFIKYRNIQIILPMYDDLLVESSNFLISLK